MIKGAYRNMVVIKNTGSRIFEEAYFVLRDGSNACSRFDIVSEANRIISDNVIPLHTEPKKKRGKEWVLRIVFLVGGIAIGVFFALII